MQLHFEAIGGTRGAGCGQECGRRLSLWQGSPVHLYSLHLSAVFLIGRVDDEVCVDRLV